MEAKLLNPKVAFGSCDVWAGPMRWRLSGEWVFYEQKWKPGGSTKQKLNRGDGVSLRIPKNSRNVRIFGRTLEGAFDYPLNKISSDSWLRYSTFTSSDDYYVLQYKVNKTPQKSSKKPEGSGAIMFGAQ